MFTKLLIANRGEIACRVMRTASRLGIGTVAVYSEADAKARHVRRADEAVCIGPAPAKASYLNIEAIVGAAKATGADAVHPGYGFLSENEDFAEACAKAGLVFVGPPAESIRAMGSKAAAKELMAKAGVPLVPGYHGPNQGTKFLRIQAEKIGFPVLIKASSGGGGKGMRIVERKEDFESALASCKREAAASFGNDRVLLERYLVRPRHIEIQVFADTQGNCVHLFERDCSVQRRHQKVLEEAPAPGMTIQRRREMGTAAIAAARAVGYVGAGTIEFIAGEDGQFYFMEMNTRLQVEHPVTEMITGLDLVELQLRVAAGEPLRLVQDHIPRRGHAIEARIYAEDPTKGFLPSTGRLIHVAAPRESVHVRVDAGVETGDEVTPHYDPMIAKLIVWDHDREQARRQMVRALSQYKIAGVTTNVEFLRRVVSCPAFADGNVDTGLIERERETLLTASEPPRDAFLIAAMAILLGESQSTGSAPASPWNMNDGWRLNGTASRELVFRYHDVNTTVRAYYEPAGFRLVVGGIETVATGELREGSRVAVTFGHRHMTATVIRSEARFTGFLNGATFALTVMGTDSAAAETAAGDRGLTAPMPGRVIAHAAATGQRVSSGAPLIIIESMKMELTIVAPSPGVVRGYPFAVGRNVTEGALLVDYEPAQ